MQVGREARAPRRSSRNDSQPANTTPSGIAPSGRWGECAGRVGAEPQVLADALRSRVALLHEQSSGQELLQVMATERCSLERPTGSLLACVRH